MESAADLSNGLSGIQVEQFDCNWILQLTNRFNIQPKSKDMFKKGLKAYKQFI